MNSWMKSSQRASEWPAAARNLRPRNSDLLSLRSKRRKVYTITVNNSAARPSLRSPINADPTEPEFRGFIGSPIAPIDLEACPRRRKGTPPGARSSPKPISSSRLCPCERRPRHTANRTANSSTRTNRRSGLHDGAVGRVARAGAASSR
jgi:hypothetical protein